MKTPTKIRLLKYLRRIFPLWAMRMQAEVIERAFDSDYAAANGWEEQQSILQQRDFEASEYWNAISAYRSRKLLNRAQRLYIDTTGLVWEHDQYANHWLDDPSLAKLHHTVVEETRKAWEFRLKIIGGTVGVLTGLAGALIGVIAIWKKGR